MIEGQTGEEIGMIRYLIGALTDKKLDLSKIQEEILKWFNSKELRNLSQVVNNALTENKNHISDITAYF